MKHREVLVIGAGPAGLAAAIEAAKHGADVLVVDTNTRPGGQLFKQIHKFFGSNAHRAGVRGIDIGTMLVEEAYTLGIEIWLSSTVIGSYAGRKVAIERGYDSEAKTLEIIDADKVVIATGASENAVRFPGWDLPGVMGAGAVQTMINVNRVKPGQNVLMIGSGNVGLIVTYQLMQAGVRVAAIVEAASKISGYAVHASKVTRAGVPIYTACTVKAALGEERVNRAVIADVGGDWACIEGTEKTLEVDTIAIAAGLTPLVRIAQMFQCKLIYEPVFSGWIPAHNPSMESTVNGVFVVGDATGIEEANTALEEGRLAGTEIARQFGKLDDAMAESIKQDIWNRLDGLRGGESGERRLSAKLNQIHCFEGQV